MSKFSFFLFSIFFGIFGAILFEFFLVPAILTNPYFEKFKFFRNIQKEIIINPIQEIIVRQEEIIPKLFLKLKESVPLIGKEENNLGCGIVITSDGFILGKKDFFDLRKKVVFLNSEKENIKIIKENEKEGLVLVKLEKNNLKTTPFQEEEIKIGEFIFLIGRKNKDTIINSGQVRSILNNRVFANLNDKDDFLFCPVFNLKGELVGIINSFNNNIAEILPIQQIRADFGF